MSLFSKTNISGTVTALSVSLTIGLASLLGLKSKLVSGNFTKTFAYWINYCVFPSLVLIIEARIENSTSLIKIKHSLSIRSFVIIWACYIDQNGTILVSRLGVSQSLFAISFLRFSICILFAIHACRKVLKTTRRIRFALFLNT